MMLTTQQQRRQLQSFKAVFQNNPNKPVGLPECLHSGFYWSKDDGGGGDTWSCKTSKAPPPTNQHPDFTRRMPFLSPNQQRQSTEWRNHHIPRTCSSPSSSGNLPSLSYSLKVPGYWASRQPS